MRWKRATGAGFTSSVARVPWAFPLGGVSSSFQDGFLLKSTRAAPFSSVFQTIGQATCLELGSCLLCFTVARGVLVFGRPCPSWPASRVFRMHYHDSVSSPLLVQLLYFFYRCCSGCRICKVPLLPAASRKLRSPWRGLWGREVSCGEERSLPGL